MATQPNPSNDGWDEIKVDFVKFLKTGDTVEGRIVLYEEMDVANPSGGQNKVGKVTVEQTDGSMVAFLLTEQLEQKITGLPVGTSIRVVYEGEVTLANKRRMRQFRVFKKN